MTYLENHTQSISGKGVPAPYRSVVVEELIVCQEQTHSIVSVIAYAESMAKGKVVGKEIGTPQDAKRALEPIPPNGKLYEVAKFACDKSRWQRG